MALVLGVLSGKHLRRGWGKKAGNIGMDAFEAKKKAVLTPFFLEAGGALLDCQGFEYGMVLLLLHFSRLGAEGLDTARLCSILDNDVKVTAGQLVKMLKKYVTVSKGIEDALLAALEARNMLIHRFLLDNVERLVDSVSRNEVIVEMRQLRAEVQKADKMLRPFIQGLSEAIDGFDGVAFAARAKEVFMDAKKTSGDKSTPSSGG